MPSKSSSTRPQPQVPRQPYSRRKPNPISKPKPPLPARATASYFVFDTILPSHVINDRSLFTSYTPSNRVYRTAFGTDVMIEGTGNVEVCVQAGGKSIIFTVHNCWHIPSSHHHFLSCSTLTSPTPNGRHQIMLAGRTPRLLFPHKDRLVTPNLPKYVPVAREQGYFVLKFKVSTKNPLPLEPAAADTKSKFPSFSLYAPSCQPFAGLASTHSSSLDETGDKLEDKETFFTESESSDAAHVFTGITDTFSPLPSFPPSLPSLPLLPQSSPISLLPFPPTLVSSQQLPSDKAAVVQVHGHADSTCYTSIDSASHGGANVPVNTVGSHGGPYYVASASAYAHRRIHHYHQQLTTMPPAAPSPATIYPVPLQHNSPPQPQQYHLQFGPTSLLPPPPSLLPPTHHPPPPTAVFLPMMTTPPPFIPHYPISPYIPRFSPIRYGYQPVQQPGVTVVASLSEVTNTNVEH